MLRLPTPRTMLADTARVLGARILLRGSAFLVLLVLARALPIRDLGFYGYLVSTLVVLGSTLDLGLRHAAARRIGRSPAETGAVAWRVLAWSLPLGVVAAMVLLALLTRGGLWPGYDDVALVGAAGAVPMLVVRIGQGVLLGRGDLARLNACELTSRGVLLAGTLAIWLAGALTIRSAVAVLALSHTVAAVHLLGQLRHDLARAQGPPPPIGTGLLAAGLRFAAVAMLSAALGRIGVWYAGHHLGADMAGLYFSVARLGEVAAELATSVGVVLFAHGVRAGDTAGVAASARTVRAVVAAAALLAAIGVALGEPLVRLLLGTGFAEAVTTFRFVLLGTVASCTTAVLTPLLSSRGHAGDGIRAFAAGLVVAAVLMPLLTDRLGLAGIAAAWASAQLATAAGLALALRARSGLGVGRLLLLRPADLAACVGPLRRAADTARGRIRRGRHRSGVAQCAAPQLRPVPTSTTSGTDNAAAPSMVARTSAAVAAVSPSGTSRTSSSWT